MRRASTLLLAGLMWTLGAIAAPVVVLDIGGAIGPATADYVHRGIRQAQAQGAQLVVLRMDTPGGLDVSMRAIVKDILAAPLPVAGFVAPSGARAASAGTYILYACHVAAMAPATNLGAATPVRIGGESPAPSGKPQDKDDKPAESGDTLSKKATHDAAAYIRSLAQLRGRNVKWAEQAVAGSASLSAEEALAARVIDLVAADLPELLKRLDGRKLALPSGQHILATAGATVTELAPDWRTRFLSTITDPSIAYVLVLLGIYAILFEFSNPGLVLPGVVGTICLLIALYAFHLLPVNYAGLALILLGIAFMAAEAFVPAYGSLGIGGLVAFVIGSVILIDADVPGLRLPLALIGGVAAASLAFLLLVVGAAVKARRRPQAAGSEALVGAIGEVLADCEGDGWARVAGETWRIRADSPLKAGRRVRVVQRRDLVLDVAPEPSQGD